MNASVCLACEATKRAGMFDKCDRCDRMEQARLAEIGFAMLHKKEVERARNAPGQVIRKPKQES